MLRRLFVLLLIACILAGILAWGISTEMAQNWALARAGTAESLLDALGVLWVARVGAPVAAFTFWVCLQRWTRTERAMRAVRGEFLQVTRLERRTLFRAALS